MQKNKAIPLTKQDGNPHNQQFVHCCVKFNNGTEKLNNKTLPDKDKSKCLTINRSRWSGNSC